jgi:hypothetical protein
LFKLKLDWYIPRGSKNRAFKLAINIVKYSIKNKKTRRAGIFQALLVYFYLIS